MIICLEMAKLPYGSDRTSVLFESLEDARGFDLTARMSKFHESEKMFADFKSASYSLRSDSNKETLPVAPKLTATDSGFVDEADKTGSLQVLKKVAFFFQGTYLHLQLQFSFDRIV